MRIVAFVGLGLCACASANDERAKGDAGSDDAPAIDARMIDARMLDAYVPDACVPTAELCNGLDDDCDGSTDEGFDVGAMCDGADTDACQEGVIACDGSGGTLCTDTTTSTVEKCNGIDDDCRNGIDDTFALNVACSVGLGACKRDGVTVCSTDQLGTACNAIAGPAAAETCGNGIDEDCSGADAICPSNDLPGGAIDISAGGQWTVDLSAAHDDNWTASNLPVFDCGDPGGRDAFYTFTLPAEEIVYFDSFGSNFDSVIRVFAGSCTAIGATKACADDECGQTRSQGAIDLAAGTYCLVVDQFSNAATTGSAVLNFKRGGRAGTVIAAANGSVSGNTASGQTDQSVASCEANSHQPDQAFAFLSCPAITYTVGASLCTGATFDTVLYMRQGAATTADTVCSDDETGCGTNGWQSKFTGHPVTGADLQWFIVDGFGTSTGGRGAFTLSYTIQ